jgi:hypothetical protein
MGKMAQLLSSVRKLFEPKVEEEIFEPIKQPVFAEKYKTIVKCEGSPNYLTMLHWVDENSKGDVDVRRPGDGWIYFAFEDPDDALVFKIMYSK